MKRLLFCSCHVCETPRPPVRLIEYETCSSFLRYFFFYSYFRNFNTAVKCSNVAQKSYCKFEKDVAYIIEDSYTRFCYNETEIETGGKNVSGSSYISAGLCFTILVLVFQLLQDIF